MKYEGGTDKEWEKISVRLYTSIWSENPDKSDLEEL